jgi:hypothetical protein
VGERLNLAGGIIRRRTYRLCVTRPGTRQVISSLENPVADEEGLLEFQDFCIRLTT